MRCVIHLIHCFKCIYVYLPTFESGALYWPKLFSWTVVAMFLYQITVLGILSLKEAPIPAAFMLPLPLFSVAFYQYCIKHFDEPAKHLTLFDTLEPLECEPHVDPFIQPALLAKPVSLQTEASGSDDHARIESEA